MRIAVISDIHGNRTAFEAVLADLRQTAPDLVLHGGDLADMGSSPVEVVDRIRDLGWQGVIGNGEEALSIPETLEKFASQSSAPPALWRAVREMVAATRALLGKGRVDWLGALPRVHLGDRFALVHASPENTWRAPGPRASDTELNSVYRPLQQPVVVYGHIHQSFIRFVPNPPEPEMSVMNAGSVSLSYDSDPRAAYLLLDESKPVVRRVEYDLEREIRALSTSGLPCADWIARILRSSSPQMP